MDFNTAVKTCFAKYATFTGRAPRSEFWWFALFGFLIGLVGLVIDTQILDRKADDVQPIALILDITLFIPSWAAAARRFHDLDKSGWFTAPFVAMTACSYIAGWSNLSFDAFADHAPVPLVLFGTVTVTLALAGYGILCLIWFCYRGTVGANRFGEDPLPPENAAIVEAPAEN